MPPRHIRILAGLLDRTAGSHVYNFQLAARLAARGHRVSVVCFAGKANQAAPGVEIVALPARGDDPAPFVWRFASAFNARHYARALAAQPLDAPDVTIGAEHLLLRPHARRFPGVPWIYLPHSLLLEHEIGSYGLEPMARWATLTVYRRAQRWALAQATRTLRFTRFAADTLEASYGGRSGARYVVNLPGTDLPAQVSTAADGPFRFLTVGRLTPTKNVELALRALAGLTEVSWRYDVVGGGDDEGRLRELCLGLGIADRVTFHGHQASPGRFYHAADLFIMPSLVESFGLVVIEAMAHGVPVIAMRHDGRTFHNPFAEIVTDGVDGYLVGTGGELTSGLRRAVLDRQAHGLVRSRARATAERRFAWDRHIDAYVALFDELSA